MRNKLRDLARVHWIGVEFSDKQLEPTLDEQVTFCEAIARAIVDSPIVLTEKNFDADEVRFLFGWSNQLKEDRTKLTQELGIHDNAIEQILQEMTPLNKRVKSIVINGDKADIFIGLIQPEQAPIIFRKWYLKAGKLPGFKLSPFAIDCVSCAVECFNENYPVFSFGCEESRQNRILSRDRLIVAIPNNSEYLLDERG